jgi:hypothetical protein
VAFGYFGHLGAPISQTGGSRGSVAIFLMLRRLEPAGRSGVSCTDGQAPRRLPPEAPDAPDVQAPCVSGAFVLPGVLSRRMASSLAVTIPTR